VLMIQVGDRAVIHFIDQLVDTGATTDIGALWGWTLDELGEVFA
jgi:hypothetical protein